MNTQATNGNGQQAGDPSTTIGVGGVTSGQSGATPSHETQQETGGSGGEQLTANQDAGAGAAGNVDNAGKTAHVAPPPPVAGKAEAPDSSMQSGARGAFDTRPDQGGGTGTGIGSPESGANQSEADLPPATGEGRTP